MRCYALEMSYVSTVTSKTVATAFETEFNLLKIGSKDLEFFEKLGGLLCYIKNLLEKPQLIGMAKKKYYTISHIFLPVAM